MTIIIKTHKRILQEFFDGFWFFLERKEIQDLAFLNGINNFVNYVCCIQKKKNVYLTLE